MNPFYAFYDRSYGYARAVITLAAGLLMVCWPTVVAKTLVIILGAFIAAAGVVSLVLSFTGKWKEEKVSLLTMNALVDIVIGIVVIVFSDFFVELIMYLFGILLLIFGLSEIVSLLRTQKTAKISWLLFVGPAITTICGIVIFFDPFNSNKWLFIFFGISLLIYSITEFMSTHTVRKILKNIQKEEIKAEIKEINHVEEAPYEDVE